MGECTRHALYCGGETGVFLILSSSSILLVRHTFAAYFGSVYVDTHGEMDLGLKRGKPMTLSARRYAALNELWAKGMIGRETTRIRSTSDRTIRLGWY
jgi:hypothetical protein